MDAIVCQDHNRRTCIAFDFSKDAVKYIQSEEGVTDVRKLSRHDFERQWSEIVGYPLLRAAKLFANPLTTAIEITPAARAVLTRILSTKEEVQSMNEIVASTTEGQQNVNATVAAGLKTGTKGVKRSTTKTRKAAPAAKTTTPKTDEESAVSTKKTATKKAAKPAKAPAKKAAKAVKPATKGGAKKLAKVAKKVPAKKAAKKSGSRAPVATGATILKYNPKNERPVKGGAVKTLVDFVASKGKAGISRDDAYAYMLKHDKEEGADQRTRYNISWCLFKGIFTRG